MSSAAAQKQGQYKISLKNMPDRNFTADKHVCMWFSKENHRRKPSLSVNRTSLNAGAAKSESTPAPSRGCIWRPNRTPKPRARLQDEKCSGAEPHRGETAERKEKHVVCIKTRTQFCKHQTAPGPDQNRLFCCPRGRTVSCCTVWEDLPAHVLYRLETFYILTTQTIIQQVVFLIPELLL